RPVTPVYHSEMELLEALQLLLDSRRAQTVDDLVRYTERAGHPAAADYLRDLAAQSLPLGLAYDALRVHLRIVAHKRGSELLKLAEGRAIGLVLPLPPQVLDAFLPLANATVLV